jgi:transposase InsO family protein
MRASPPIGVVRMTHAANCVDGDAVFHSDRGLQHASKQLRDELIRFEMRQSTERAVSCLDNASDEYFFVVLKRRSGVREWANRALAGTGVPVGCWLLQSHEAALDHRLDSARPFLQVC